MVAPRVRSLLVATAVGLLAGALTRAGEPDSGGKKDLAKLDGTWRTVGGEDGGREISPEDVKSFDDEYVFKDGTMTFRRRGRVFAEFKATVDPAKTPKEMDLANTKDEGREACRAIYSLDGDKLTICTANRFNPSGADERPNVFSTRKEQDASKRSGLLLLVLERQK